ncbi:MAG: type II secretion system GspH family protein [Abditibacteriales bacterium]|nr:type II secretion system GspH family protein [Abditibacteriales bacterium]MDW8365598.1 type II secretion system protein [Abditibacteriales bacterium]
MLTSHRPRQSGFTLLELMVALVILALGIVGLMRAVSQGMAATAQIRDVTTATTLAQMKMEELASHIADLPAESRGDFGDEAPEFSWRAVAEETDIAGLKKITVFVFWQRGNRQQSVTLETCVSENMQVTPLEEMEDSRTVASDQ